jgi:predicted amidophosphoribosyltransferase
MTRWICKTCGKELKREGDIRICRYCGRTLNYKRQVVSPGMLPTLSERRMRELAGV